ncbi:MAG: BamA/TamA family outer membrane protein [Bacteroidales bacterium]|nr:BamA/TamA family outer membrane protein [Bacteroidales bacterium]
MKRVFFRIGTVVGILLSVFLMGCLLGSCSTTRTIPEGSYRLLDNYVQVTNLADYPEYSASDITSYIRQKPNSYLLGHWSPRLSVYNWSNGKDDWWNRTIKKFGQEPVLMDVNLVEQSKSNIEIHLNYLGYYHSQVLDSIAAEDKKAKVFYEITLGKTYPISEIRYEIPDSTIRALYLRDTANSLVQRGTRLSEKVLEAESERAANLIRNHGYYGFSKNYFFFEADTVAVKDSAVLYFKILNYTRNESPDMAREHRQFRIGDVYIYPVSDLIRYQASLSTGIEPRLDTLRWDNFSILYDKTLDIRPSVLQRMNRMEPDSLYNESMVNNTYQRFSNMQMYNSVNLILEERDSNQVDCTIRLVPSKVSGYKLNFEASTNSTGLLGNSGTLTYYHRNLFHGGEWFNLSLMGNFQYKIKDPTHSTELGGTASLSLPTFLFVPDRFFTKIQPRTDMSLGYNYQDRPEYKRNLISGTLGYSWNNPSRTMYYAVTPIQADIVKIFNMKESFYENLQDPFLQESYKDHFILGSGFSYYYTNDPAMNPQGSRFYTRLQFDIAGNILSLFNPVMEQNEDGVYTIWGSPYSQYVRLEWTTGYTWKFGKNNKQALAMRLVQGIGYAYGNSSSVPFEKLFWSGGANSMRGWQARTLGPGSSPQDKTFLIPNQTGDIKMEANLEYRFPLFWYLNGAVFFDAGNVWTLRRDDSDTEVSASTELGQFGGKDFFKTIALNTGLGLRLDLDFVVVRFDLGIKLYEPVEQQWRTPQQWLRGDGYALQFSVGYPF